MRHAGWAAYIRCLPLSRTQLARGETLPSNPQSGQQPPSKQRNALYHFSSLLSCPLCYGLDTCSSTWRRVFPDVQNRLPPVKPAAPAVAPSSSRRQNSLQTKRTPPAELGRFSVAFCTTFNTNPPTPHSTAIRFPSGRGPGCHWGSVARCAVRVHAAFTCQWGPRKPPRPRSASCVLAQEEGLHIW